MKILKFILLVILFSFFATGIVFAFEAGDKVSCNWKGKGKYYKGTIASVSGNRVSIDYDDGDKETTSKSRCRLLSSSSSGRPTKSSGQKNFNDYFAEAANRLRNHPSDRNLKIDPKVVGSFVRMEAGPSRSYSLNVYTNEFSNNGRGQMTIEKVYLNKQMQLSAETTAQLPFTWGVELHKTNNNEPVTLVRMKFNDGSSILFYYAIDTKNSMGAVLFDEQSNRAGNKVLFVQQSAFQKDWAANNSKVRDTLVQSYKTNRDIDEMKLINQNMMMGNNNMLMLKTMNAGFTGMFQ